ncbi:MAG: hypothetical protein DRQ39_10730 [Gammaproteobacteria bacterium]|nr:MAG: hypothetical protein DRQ39_10730 [Gammaproteobacteria bacterium]
MFQKIVHISATILWLCLIVILALIWRIKIRFGVNGIVIPYLILFLSLYVFNRTPSIFRRIHHGFISPVLLISLSVSYYFVFHGGDQGSVGAYLLTYSVIATYLVFISMFLLALGLYHFHHKGHS